MALLDKQPRYGFLLNHLRYEEFLEGDDLFEVEGGCHDGLGHNLRFYLFWFLSPHCKRLYRLSMK